MTSIRFYIGCCLVKKIWVQVTTVSNQSRSPIQGSLQSFNISTEVCGWNIRWAHIKWRQLFTQTLLSHTCIIKAWHSDVLENVPRPQNRIEPLLAQAPVLGTASANINNIYLECLQYLPLYTPTVYTCKHVA